MYILSNLRTFCVISFTDGVNLSTYCENLRTYCVRFCTNVEINSKVFIGLIPFQTIYVPLLQISKCGKLRVFDAIFLPQKLRSCNFFLTNIKHC